MHLPPRTFLTDSLRVPFLQIHSVHLNTAAEVILDGSSLRWQHPTTAADDDGSVLRRQQRPTATAASYEPTSTTAVVIMMRRSTKRNADTGLLRRLPKRNAPVNARFMHFGAVEISVL